MAGRRQGLLHVGMLPLRGPPECQGGFNICETPDVWLDWGSGYDLGSPLEHLNAVFLQSHSGWSSEWRTPPPRLSPDATVDVLVEFVDGIGTPDPNPPQIIKLVFLIYFS